jgi:Holliday junction resolvase-like predicted endonuclease
MLTLYRKETTMSKAKDIGTRAETAVRNYLLSTGYSALEAHRNVLKGSDDEGDVWLRDPNGLIVFEIKGGKMAKEASYGQVEKWIAEAELEASNANARFGFLVTQRAGVGYPRAGEWWAYARLGDLINLRVGLTNENPTVVRLLFSDLVKLIHG